VSWGAAFLVHGDPCVLDRLVALVREGDRPGLRRMLATQVAAGPLLDWRPVAEQVALAVLDLQADLEGGELPEGALLERGVLAAVAREAAQLGEPLLPFEADGWRVWDWPTGEVLAFRAVGKVWGEACGQELGAGPGLLWLEATAEYFAWEAKLEAAARADLEARRARARQPEGDLLAVDLASVPDQRTTDHAAAGVSDPGTPAAPPADVPPAVLPPSSPVLTPAGAGDQPEQRGGGAAAAEPPAGPTPPAAPAPSPGRTTADPPEGTAGVRDDVGIAAIEASRLKIVRAAALSALKLPARALLWESAQQGRPSQPGIACERCGQALADAPSVHAVATDEQGRKVAHVWAHTSCAVKAVADHRAGPFTIAGMVEELQELDVPLRGDERFWQLVAGVLAARTILDVDWGRALAARKVGRKERPCVLCEGVIAAKQEYADGGADRAAHVGCATALVKARSA
jgi:hypothetical protein